ncbi:MAG: hypothetical protein ABII27_02920 [bacterium]
MFKIIFWIIICMTLVYFAFRSCNVQEKVDKSAPAEYLKSMPQKVESASEVQIKANKLIIQNALQLYYVEKGEFPKTLQELSSAGYLSRIPVGNWEYDGNGEVDIAR